VEVGHAGVLHAFDANSQLIESATSTPGVPESICITAPDIRSVAFSGDGDRFAWFDNLTVDFPPSGISTFLRGDCNDDGRINVSDAVFVLNRLFLGGPALNCLAAANTNGDAAVNIADPSYLLNHLFVGGPAPLFPFPACGRSDLEADAALGCDETSCK